MGSIIEFKVVKRPVGLGVGGRNATVRTGFRIGRGQILPVLIRALSLYLFGKTLYKGLKTILYQCLTRIPHFVFAK